MFKSSVFASMPLRLALAGVMAMLLSACALPPERPQAADLGLQLPASWKHAPAVAGWASAEQAADWAAGQWWRVFRDDTLDGLMGQLEQANPGLQLAAANVAQAQAVLREQQAQRWPQLGAQLGQQRSGGEGRAASGSASLNLAASWAPDLWGRVALAVEAQQASVQASQADLAGVRLAAQASLAQAYLGLRATDAELELLEDVIAGYERAAEIARNRHAVGVAARTDAVQAEATLENALASRVALQRSRDAYEHAIAVLLGQAPAGFALAEADWNTRVPALPAELPSLLLLRRPDLASAERAVTAANTRIGLARAAFWCSTPDNVSNCPCTFHPGSSR